MVPTLRVIDGERLANTQFNTLVDKCTSSQPVSIPQMTNLKAKQPIINVPVFNLEKELEADLKKFDSIILFYKILLIILRYNE